VNAEGDGRLCNDAAQRFLPDTVHRVARAVVGTGRRLLDPARLGRPSTGAGFIPEIDGLRLFAIGTVITYHANIQACRSKFPGIQDSELDQLYSSSWLTEVLAQGNVGVPVFFAISGFVLGLPFARHRLKGGPPVLLGPYFERRLSRLEVPYLLALLLALVGAIAAGREWSLGNLAASAAYVHMFVFGTKSTINPVAWSLEIEVQFYCLAPLLAGLYLIGSSWCRALALACLMIPSIIMRAFYDDALRGIHLDQSLLGYGFYFLTGMVVLEMYLSDLLAPTKKRHAAFDVLGVLSVVVLLWPDDESKFVRAISFVPSCIGLFIAAFRGRLFNAFFRSTWVVLIGGMCYSIYLLHYGIMIAISAKLGPRLVVDGPLWLTSAIFLMTIAPLSVLPCIVFYLLVERPCMRRGWHREVAGRLRLLLGTAGRIEGTK
jgi:peptidoglycan/LPS O-acetylase OafA/YrhL